MTDHQYSVLYDRLPVRTMYWMTDHCPPSVNMLTNLIMEAQGLELEEQYRLMHQERQQVCRRATPHHALTMLPYHACATIYTNAVVLCCPTVLCSYCHLTSPCPQVWDAVQRLMTSHYDYNVKLVARKLNIVLDELQHSAAALVIQS